MSTDPALLWNAPKPPPPEPKPTEPLWTVRRGIDRVDARLLDHGPYGLEVQLYWNGGFYAGRRFALGALALKHSEYLKREMVADGWAVSSETRQ